MNAVRRALRSINPIGSGTSAIFQKEVRGSGRRLQTYWTRGGCALLLSGISGLAFLGITHDEAITRGAQSLQELQRLAPTLASIVLWFQFFALMLAGPVLAGSSLSDERQRKTLPALLTTPITAGQIVAGKLLGAMIQIVILALIPLPVLLGARLLGGLDADAVLAGTAVTLASAVLGSSYALLASIRASRGIAAASFAIAMLLLFHGLFPFMLMAARVWLAQRFGISIPEWAPTAACPALSLGVVTQGLMGFGGGSNPWGTALVSVGGSLSVSALLLFVATARLRRVMADGGEPAAKRTKAASPAKAAAGATAGMASREDAPPHADGVGGQHPASIAAGAASDEAASEAPGEAATSRSRASREVSDHPVLWRELRAGAFRSKRQFVIAAVFMTVLLGAIYVFGDLKDSTMHQVIAVFGAMIFAASAAIASVGVFGAERENMTWAILLTTPIPPGRIVQGKFLGGLKHLWFIPAALALHLLMVAPLNGYLRVVPLAIYGLNLTTIAIFLTASGVFLSLVCRRSSTAGVLNILLALGLWLALPVLVAFLASLTRLVGGGGDAGEALFTLNPVALAIMCSGEIAQDREWSLGTNATFRLSWIDHTSGEYAAWCALVWGVYVLVSLGILGLTSLQLRLRRDRYL